MCRKKVKVKEKNHVSNAHGGRHSFIHSLDSIQNGHTFFLALFSLFLTIIILIFFHLTFRKEFVIIIVVGFGHFGFVVKFSFNQAFSSLFLSFSFIQTNGKKL